MRAVGQAEAFVSILLGCDSCVLTKVGTASRAEASMGVGGVRCAR